MSGEHYKIIVAGYNCKSLIRRCAESIANQTYDDYDVCLVDDASTEPGQRELAKEVAEEYGWKFLQREENAGALRSQHEGILLMEPKDGDVIVWVDMDDAFATPNALEILDSYYDDETPMAYGSYKSVPHSPTCAMPRRYPRECELANDYRDMHKWGIQVNHLRTVRWDLYRRLEPEVDFMRAGRWLSLSSDPAVMIPCLEMSGGMYKFIPDVLYAYTSDNPISEWRKDPRGTNVTHNYIQNLPKKRPIWPQILSQKTN